MDDVDTYQALIDRKFRGGLTEQEARELAEVEKRLDASNDGFYRPIIERLRAAIERRDPASAQADKEEEG